MTARLPVSAPSVSLASNPAARGPAVPLRGLVPSSASGAAITASSSIRALLAAHDMPEEYAVLLMDKGGLQDVTDLALASDDDLQKLGIEKLFHRRKLLQWASDAVTTGATAAVAVKPTAIAPPSSRAGVPPPMNPIDALLGPGAAVPVVRSPRMGAPVGGVLHTVPGVSERPGHRRTESTDSASDLVAGHRSGSAAQLSGRTSATNGSLVGPRHEGGDHVLIEILGARATQTFPMTERDYYCKVSLCDVIEDVSYPVEGTTQRTPNARGPEPIWDCTLRLPTNFRSHSIAIELKERHLIGENKHVGFAIFPASYFHSFSETTKIDSWMSMVQTCDKNSPATADVRVRLSVPGGCPKYCGPAFHVTSVYMEGRKVRLNVFEAKIPAVIFSPSSQLASPRSEGSSNTSNHGGMASAAGGGGSAFQPSGSLSDVGSSGAAGGPGVDVASPRSLYASPGAQPQGGSLVEMQAQSARETPSTYVTVALHRGTIPLAQDSNSATLANAVNPAGAAEAAAANSDDKDVIRKVRTRTVLKSFNPVFDDVMEFTQEARECKYITVKLKRVRKGILGIERKKVLGFVHLPLQYFLAQKDSFEIDHVFGLINSRKPEAPQCQLHLRLQVLPSVPQATTQFARTLSVGPSSAPPMIGGIPMPGALHAAVAPPPLPVRDASGSVGPVPTVSSATASRQPSVRDAEVEHDPLNSTHVTEEGDDDPAVAHDGAVSDSTDDDDDD